MQTPGFALSPTPFTKHTHVKFTTTRRALRPRAARNFRTRAVLEPETSDSDKRIEVLPEKDATSDTLATPDAVKAPDAAETTESSTESVSPQPVKEVTSDEPVPGKIQMNELELAAQRRELENYSAELRRSRLEEEREASRIFGFVDYAETLNGRLAMFFLVTGLLTEYWTGYTIPEQVELMARTLGIL